MLKIPVSQTATGDGNTTLTYSSVNYGSIQVTYSGGTGSVSITVYASNEKTPTNWASIGSISLDTTTTTAIYDIKGKYRHVKLTIDSITDGSVTAEPY